MQKAGSLFILFLFISLVSCEKKDVAPNGVVKNPPVSQDTASGKIYTMAGNGTQGYSGDGGPAIAAEIGGSWAVSVDASDNVYFTDNQCIRKINTSGIITTFAGNGTQGYSGDGGLATSAELYNPLGIAVDLSGNVYITDNSNNRIRKVNTSGIISTFAGNGIAGYSGDGGPATAAKLSLPMGLALDGMGNLYIADCQNERIRMVNTKGIISTVAGGDTTGHLGDGGPATSAELYNPNGVALDASGNVYIATYYDNRIRKVDANGIISTIAGNGFGFPYDGGYAGDGGPATAAELNHPTDVVVDASGNVYFADADNGVIRMVNTSGIISTYAGNGNGTYSGDGGLAKAAGIGFSQGIALDASGNLYITELYFNRVRVVYK